MANRTDHGSKFNLIHVYQKILRSNHVMQNIAFLLPIWNFSHRVIINSGSLYANYKLLSVLLEFNNYCDPG